MDHVPGGGVGALLLGGLGRRVRLPGLAVVALAGLGLCQGLAHWVHARAFALAPVGALAPYEYTACCSAAPWLGGVRRTAHPRRPAGRGHRGRSGAVEPAPRTASPPC